MRSFLIGARQSRDFGFSPIRTTKAVVITALLAVGAITQAVTLAPLNDTGLLQCYDSTGTVIGCASNGADDGRYGRDAAAGVGLLSRIGAGAAGFDFTKIANDSSVLAGGAALGSNPTDWACTRDNVTGLTWEVKTSSGLRSGTHTYTWYDTDATRNGGDAGSLGANSCGGTLSAYSNQCNTTHYAAAVNASGLCGQNDWRLPSLRELESLVHFGIPTTGAVPAIDVSHFPNTQASYYASATNYWFPLAYWSVVFNNGKFSNQLKSAANYVRLVRGGQ